MVFYFIKAGHPPMILSVTNCITTDLFTEIKSATVTKTGKKGKSKKKGKKVRVYKYLKYTRNVFLK